MIVCHDEAQGWAEKAVARLTMRRADAMFRPTVFLTLGTHLYTHTHTHTHTYTHTHTHTLAHISILTNTNKFTHAHRSKTRRDRFSRIFSSHPRSRREGKGETRHVKEVLPPPAGLAACVYTLLPPAKIDYARTHTPSRLRGPTPCTARAHCLTIKKDPRTPLCSVLVYNNDTHTRVCRV